MSEPDKITVDETEADSNSEAGWPLSYQLKLPKPNPGQGAPRVRWWSHNLYFGPNDTPVQVLYSKTKEDSEKLAKQFLDEPILGFDMEWPIFPKSDRLQEKIGLIQVACENKIALFHIGVHAGTTTDEIIAPSLQKIIESESITKTGVAVLHADFKRLREFFGLKPQAAFELSHLHRLVHFGAHRPDLITTKMVKLAYQVETHLGFPLSKGPVRTSNWSRPLNQQQIDYAAADAYAGFMLFKRMNAKRLKMDPTPPLPLLADKYPVSGSKFKPLQLHPLEEGGPTTTVASFFEPKEDATNAQDSQMDTETVVANPNPDMKAEVEAETEEKAKGKRKGKQSQPKQEPTILDGDSQALYNGLSARRKVLATSEGVPAFCIASNAVLESLAQQRPLDNDAVLKIKGIGKRKLEKYGAEWLQVIAQFTASKDMEDPEPVQETLSAAPAPVVDAQAPVPQSTPTRATKRRRVSTFGGIEDLGSSSPAFDTPPPRAPILHTGLSFTMAEAQLDSEGEVDAPDGDGNSNLRVSGCGPENEESAPDDGAPQNKPLPADPPEAEPIPLELRLFRNKLLAFSKLVSRHLKPLPLTPIVSEWTLDRIVSSRPRTERELKMIPGIDSFVEACARTGKDLLFHINKFAPAQ